MEEEKKEAAEWLYLLLSGLFIAALVVCNLIANKFVSINIPFINYELTISAGVLPYPVTFLITDILSELYGRTRTYRVVISGFFASLFVLGVLWLAGQFPAIATSPVDNETYDLVFKNAWRVVFASMVAYLTAQLIDVRIFHFWKKLTRGRMLWLRNNGSTILSQFVDTTLVVVVLFIGVLPAETIMIYILHGWLFKVGCALLDTPLFYFAVYGLKGYFGLQQHEELEFA